MTYKEALEMGVEKWEKIAELQEALNNFEGDSSAERIFKLIYSECSLCNYHHQECGLCILHRKELCIVYDGHKDNAYYRFRYSQYGSERLTAARQIRDALREELRRVTEEEAGK
jgi:hypothetical protein